MRQHRPKHVQSDMQKRINANRRKRFWRMLRMLIFMGLLAWGSVRTWQYLHSPGFAFGTLKVQGSNVLSQEELVRMSGSDVPLNIFNASLSRLRDGLKQDFRVESSEVSYKFPAEIDVTVKEREAALYVANSYNSYFKVDHHGVVMSVTTGIPDAKAPLLVGARCGNIYLGDVVKNDQVLQVLGFLNQLDKEMVDRIAEIDLDADGNVKLAQRGSFPIILGPVKNLTEKVKIFKIVYAEIKNKNIAAECINLSFAKPYIKLLPKQDTVVAKEAVKNE